MNDQTWKDPGARASATEVTSKSWRDWADNTLQRAILASDFSHVLAECDPRDRLDFLEDAHEVLRAGWPGVPFGSVMDHAAFWADSASRSEHKAYALACYERLSDQDRAAFLAYVQRGAAA